MGHTNFDENIPKKQVKKCHRFLVLMTSTALIGSNNHRKKYQWLMVSHVYPFFGDIHCAYRIDHKPSPTQAQIHFMRNILFSLNLNAAWKYFQNIFKFLILCSIEFSHLITTEKHRCNSWMQCRTLARLFLPTVWWWIRFSDFDPEYWLIPDLYYSKWMLRQELNLFALCGLRRKHVGGRSTVEA